jgi:hypothetical protein
MSLYTVWVEGVEVNNYYLNKSDADKLATVFIDDNYENVIVEEIKL